MEVAFAEVPIGDSFHKKLYAGRLLVRRREKLIVSLWRPEKCGRHESILNRPRAKDESRNGHYHVYRCKCLST